MNDQGNDGTGQSGDSSRGQQASHDHARSLSRLTELARRDLPPAPSAHESAAAYRRFSDVAPRPITVLRWARLPLATVAVGVVAALGLWRWTAPAVAPLGLTVAGAALEEGGFVRAGLSGKPSLRFSDGTEVSLGPSSRARVTETTGNGARVLLEEGRADARVVARKGAAWVFDAGPCRIHVTGTRFDMTWSAREQILEVRLHHGGVTVKGPPAMAGVPMRPGQRLLMNVRQRSVALTDLVAEATTSSAPSKAPAVPETAPPGAVTGTSGPPPSAGALAGAGARRGESSSSSSPSPSSWPARVLAGEFRSVTEEAERRGIDDVLRGESAANLMALADAARYADASPLASRTLLKVRARFPRTSPAHKAAFLLGRMAEDQHGNLGKALQWYDTYLADAPDDAFRAEAMGRRMTATLRLSGTAQASTFAAEYLRRYPHGAYAQAARAILSP